MLFGLVSHCWQGCDYFGGGVSSAGMTAAALPLFMASS